MFNLLLSVDEPIKLCAYKEFQVVYRLDEVWDAAQVQSLFNTSLNTLKSLQITSWSSAEDLIGLPLKHTTMIFTDFIATIPVSVETDGCPHCG